MAGSSSAFSGQAPKPPGLPPEKRHPHVLKHSLASHLVAGNVNLALLQQAFGHCALPSNDHKGDVSASKNNRHNQGAVSVTWMPGELKNAPRL
jgi:site-specific recombinase XerC